MSAPADAQPAMPPRMIWWLSVSAFAAAANIRLADPLLPMIGADFGTTAANASVITATYAITFGVLQLVYGPLADRIGKLRVIIATSAMAGLFCIGCGLSLSLGMLAVLRGLVGGMAAGVIPVALAYIGDSVPYERRQQTIARLMMGATLGMAFGQALGGLTASQVGWRVSLSMFGPLYLIGALLIRYEAGPLRRPGAAQGDGALRAVAAGLVDIFGLFRGPAVRAVIVTVFAEGAFLLGAFTFVGSHLNEHFGLGFDMIGLVIALYGVGGLAYTSVTPMLLGRLGEGGLLVLGSVLVAASLAAAAFAPSWIWFAPIVFFLGAGFMMVHLTLQARATQMAPARRGAAMSLFAGSLFLAQTVGVPLMGVLYAHFGAAPGFLLAACVIPIAMLWFRRWIMRADRHSRAEA